MSASLTTSGESTSTTGFTGVTNYEQLSYAFAALSFPQKLFALLEREDECFGDSEQRRNAEKLIQWHHNGLCFRINECDRFTNEIVPKYFKQTKLTSFQRQLNLYGFRRLKRGEEAGCYFHPSFQRGRRELLSEVKRMPPKGSLMAYDQVLAYQARLPTSRYKSTTNNTSAMAKDGTHNVKHITKNPLESQTTSRFLSTAQATTPSINNSATTTKIPLNNNLAGGNLMQMSRLTMNILANNKQHFSVLCNNVLQSRQQDSDRQRSAFAAPTHSSTHSSAPQPQYTNINYKYLPPNYQTARTSDTKQRQNILQELLNAPTSNFARELPQQSTTQPPLAWTSAANQQTEHAEVDFEEDIEFINFLRSSFQQSLQHDNNNENSNNNHHNNYINHNNQNYPAARSEEFRPCCLEVEVNPHASSVSSISCSDEEDASINSAAQREELSWMRSSLFSPSDSHETIHI